MSCQAHLKAAVPVGNPLSATPALRSLVAELPQWQSMPGFWFDQAGCYGLACQLGEKLSRTLKVQQLAGRSEGNLS